MDQIRSNSIEGLKEKIQFHQWPENQEITVLHDAQFYYAEKGGVIIRIFETLDFEGTVKDFIGY